MTSSPYPVHVNHKFFNLQKTRAVIHQTTPNTLLSSFLALFSNVSTGNWSNSDIKNFQGIGKIHGKILITSSSRDRQFPDRIFIFPRYYRVNILICIPATDHQEHDAKTRLSIPITSFENTLAEVVSVKKN